MTEEMNLFKMSGPQIRLCLFTFRPIASKQLNSLLTTDTLRLLGGAVVTHPLLVQEVPCSNSRLKQGFLGLIFCFVIVVFLLLVHKHIFCHNILQIHLQC